MIKMLKSRCLCFTVSTFYILISANCIDSNMHKQWHISLSKSKLSGNVKQWLKDCVIMDILYFISAFYADSICCNAVDEAQLDYTANGLIYSRVVNVCCWGNSLCSLISPVLTTEAHRYFSPVTVFNCLHQEISVNKCTPCYFKVLPWTAL